MKKKIGVLALQGDFEAHIKMLDALGVPSLEVRTRRDLGRAAGLIIPGGETTTLDRLLRANDMHTAISDRYKKGALPVYGTCMGMILLAKSIDKFPELFTFGFIDMTVERNAYGRQVDSFEADIKIDFKSNGASEKPFNAVFIRAPRILNTGPDVEVLASHKKAPVLVKQGKCLAGSFHPELTGDLRVHNFFWEKFVNAQ